MTWLAVLTVLWLVVAVLARQAQQRGSARVARRWTIRLYAVTLVPATVLGVGGALVGVQLAFAQAGTEEAVAAATPYAQWLAIAINLVIVDMVIRRRDVAGGHGARQTSARNVATSTGWPVLATSIRPLPRPVPTGAVTRTQPAGIQVHEAFTFEAAPSPRP